MTNDKKATGKDSLQVQNGYDLPSLGAAFCSEWVSCADAMPDDGFDCEIRYEDGSTGFGFYTGNDPHALDGWMCDVTHQMATGPKDNGAVVAWRKYSPNKEICQ